MTNPAMTIRKYTERGYGGAPCSLEGKQKKREKKKKNRIIKTELKYVLCAQFHCDVCGMCLLLGLKKDLEHRSRKTTRGNGEGGTEGGTTRNQNTNEYHNKNTRPAGQLRVAIHCGCLFGGRELEVVRNYDTEQRYYKKQNRLARLARFGWWGRFGFVSFWLVPVNFRFRNRDIEMKIEITRSKT